MANLSPAAQAVRDVFKTNRVVALDGNSWPALAAALRAVANQPQEVPVHVQGDSYWPYVNGIEAMQGFLDRLADELEGR